LELQGNTARTDEKEGKSEIIVQSTLDNYTLGITTIPVVTETCIFIDSPYISFKTTSEKFNGLL